MNNLIAKGYAERAPEKNVESVNRMWYIPHNSVCHPENPGKIRIVFDCSATCEGKTLNQYLLSGPSPLQLMHVPCGFLINAKLVKEVSFRINAKLVKEELISTLTLEISHFFSPDINMMEKLISIIFSTHKCDNYKFHLSI